jgi:hypothetical protein
VVQLTLPNLELPLRLTFLHAPNLPHPSPLALSPPLQGVNTTLFDPTLYEPLPDLEARAQLVFGRPWCDKAAARKVVGAGAAQAAGAGEGSDYDTGSSGGAAAAAAAARRRPGREPFRFISSFKWEVGGLGRHGPGLPMGAALAPALCMCAHTLWPAPEHNSVPRSLPPLPRPSPARAGTCCWRRSCRSSLLQMMLSCSSTPSPLATRGSRRAFGGIGCQGRGGCAVRPRNALANRAFQTMRRLSLSPTCCPPCRPPPCRPLTAVLRENGRLGGRQVRLARAPAARRRLQPGRGWQPHRRGGSRALCCGRPASAGGPACSALGRCGCSGGRRPGRGPGPAGRRRRPHPGDRPGDGQRRRRGRGRRSRARQRQCQQRRLRCRSGCGRGGDGAAGGPHRHRPPGPAARRGEAAAAPAARAAAAPAPRRAGAPPRGRRGAGDTELGSTRRGRGQRRQPQRPRQLCSGGRRRRREAPGGGAADGRRGGRGRGGGRAGGAAAGGRQGAGWLAAANPLRCAGAPPCLPFPPEHKARPLRVPCMPAS